MRVCIRVAVVIIGCLLAVPMRGNAAAPVPRVWPLGDSITLGSSRPEPVPGGYRTGLDAILTRDGFAHLMIGTTTLNDSPTLRADGEAAHDGHGGFRIDQVLRDLDGALRWGHDGGHWLTGTPTRRPLSPDVALVHLGTNDILQHWDTRRFPTSSGRADLANPAQRARFVADMTQRLRTLLTRIHALRPRCRLAVATVVPIATPVLGKVTADYAAAVRRLVDQLRRAHYPVRLVDVYSAFLLSGTPGQPVVPGLLSSDAVHPSAAGYAVMARAFASAVEGV